METILNPLDGEFIPNFMKCTDFERFSNIYVDKSTSLIKSVYRESIDLILDPTVTPDFDLIQPKTHGNKKLFTWHSVIYVGRRVI